MLKTLAVNHPVLLAISMTLLGFAMLLLTSGIAYAKPGQPYGDAAVTMMRLALAAALVLFTWRMGWIEETGISRLGRWQVWLLAGAGLLYFASAALYAIYGRVAFDFSNLRRLPAARGIISQQLAAGIYEELLFRGVILYVLVSAWGRTRMGMLTSVFLTAALCALPHFFGIFMGLSRLSALLLVLEEIVIAMWWGALVVLGAVFGRQSFSILS